MKEKYLMDFWKENIIPYTVISLFDENKKCVQVEILYQGELNSYLIEITRDIFSVKDGESDDFLVDKIMDRAGAKGTGKWMSQLALDLGVPSTLVTEAVYARCLSAMKDSRVLASKMLQGPSSAYDGDRKQFIEQIRQALFMQGEMFRDAAPMTASDAARVILDGVRARRWRILVGEDAAVLDRMVREDPEGAYDREFMDRLVAASNWGLGNLVG